MKIASFTRDGVPSYGIVVGQNLIDAGARLRDRFTDLKAVLAAGALPEVVALAGAGPDLTFEQVTFLPTIGKPDKIICIGLNYRTHAAELGSALPSHPVIFHRFAASQVGHRQALVRPRASEQFDFEGEVAIIIGKAGRHVPREDALGLVAGYTLFQDGSIRDWQFHTHQYGPGKTFDGSGAMGPWMVTADEVADPAALTLATYLNGAKVQEGSLRDLIFDVPALIEYITTYTELVPGDVISTGTPSGVGMGRKPPLWLKAGDIVEIEAPAIGVLSNPVIDEP